MIDSIKRIFKSYPTTTNEILNYFIYNICIDGKKCNVLKLNRMLYDFYTTYNDTYGKFPFKDSFMVFGEYGAISKVFKNSIDVEMYPTKFNIIECHNWDITENFLELKKRIENYKNIDDPEIIKIASEIYSKYKNVEIFLNN